MKFIATAWLMAKDYLCKGPKCSSWQQKKISVTKTNAAKKWFMLPYVFTKLVLFINIQGPPIKR